MARVTTDEVREIFETSLEEDRITACITAANLIITETVAASTNPVVPTSLLKEIERWLSAHLCAIQDPVPLRVKIGEAEQWSFPASVTTAFGKGLLLSPYGQQAVMLDISGTLAKLGMMQASYRAAPRENSSNYTSDLN